MRYKLEALEDSVLKLTRVHTKLLQQRAELQVSVQLKDSQIARHIRKIEILDRQTNNLKDEVNFLNLQCDNLKAYLLHAPGGEELLAQPQFAQAAPSYVMQSNVLKPIRGGSMTETHKIVRKTRVSLTSGFFSPVKVGETASVSPFPATAIKESAKL